MSLVDIAVLLVVVALVALAVRAALRANKGGCTSCGSASGCSARQTEGPCPAASDMLRRAEKSLGPRG